METLGWTYEVAPAGEGAAGLEEYVAETADGDEAGKVHVVLERAGRTYVVLDRGAPPAVRELVAVPVEDVEAVDHAALRVRLRARSEDDLAAFPRLDPARKVERSEGDDVAVDARRVVDPTGTLAPTTVSPDSPRVADTGVAPLAIATGIASAFTLLVLVLMATAGAGTWQWLLLAAAALVALAAGLLTYRAWRRPYSRV